MDNNYNQQTNPYQQGNSYQQGNPYQQNDPNANPYMYNSYNGYGSSYNYGSNLEPQKAPNVFQQFVLAFIPPQYNRLIKVKTGSMIGFVTLLALVATLISAAFMVFNTVTHGGMEWVDSIPDFEIADGRLYMNDDFVYDESGMFVYMTDDIDGFTYDTASAIAKEGYRSILLIGRDKISIWSDGEYQEGDISKLGDIEIDKDWIANSMMPFLMVLVAIAYIIFFVGRVFWYFLCAAVYLLFAMIIASVRNKKLSGGELFRVAVYSKVLMFVVATLLDVIPFVSFSVPFILRIAVTIGFMIFAIEKLPEKN